jgi:hypothetical protein
MFDLQILLQAKRDPEVSVGDDMRFAPSREMYMERTMPVASTKDSLY